MKPKLLFIKEFLKNPHNVGSVIPSSKMLAESMIDGVFSSLAPQKVVELGPGTGVMTHRLYDRQRPGDEYMAFEISPKFQSHLRSKFGDLKVYADDAANLENYIGPRDVKLDFVISSLPFTSLPKEHGRRILRAIHSVLKDGGVFRTFFYVHTRHMPRNQRFIDDVSRFFCVTEQRIVLRNFPPAVVISFRKNTLPSLTEQKSNG